MAWIFFYLSGATGLIYEVLWTRRLTLTFGHTVLAVSTVLTAFMAGLALGSLLGGLWTDRKTQGRAFIKDYGRLELLIGAWAVLSLPLLSLVEQAYFSLARSGTSGLPLYLICFVFSTAVLLPPTTAMGATLPVITQHLVGSHSELGAKLSRLYGVNTLGAVCGAALAGYILLPVLGLNLSVALAATLNIGIGVAALASQRLIVSKSHKAPDDSGPLPQSGLLAGTFACTGMAAMILQVAWTRGLALSLGSSVYAFSTILVIFLGGLSLGSLAYSRLTAGRKPQLYWLSGLQLGIGLAASATIPAIGYLPWAFVKVFPYVSKSFWQVILADLILCGLVLILPTLLLGVGFPLVTQLFSKERNDVGRSIGFIYSANSVGCIVGSFLAGFFLIPQLGVQKSLELACCGLFLSSAFLWYSCARSAKHRAFAGLALLLAGTVWSLPQWDPGVVSGGVAIYAGNYANTGEDQLAVTLFRRPAYLKDGISSTVSVNVYGEENIAVRVNGKSDASLDKADKLTMELIGWLPALYRTGQKRALAIGLGSGFTLRALCQNANYQRVDCVELEPAMVEANRYWAPYNGRVLDDPKVRMHVTDGRTYILASPTRYDAICSEPSNPWIAGIGNLFTYDFYESCKARMAPGGLMCQWCNLYALSNEDLRMVLKGFLKAFPYVDVWQTAAADIVLVGSAQPLQRDYSKLGPLQENPSWREDLLSMDLIVPECLEGHYVCDRETLWPLVEDAQLNTDDKPLLEFSAPLSLYRSEQIRENYDWIRRLVSHKRPANFPAELEWAPLYGYANLADANRLETHLAKLPDGYHRRWLQLQLLRIRQPEYPTSMLKDVFDANPAPEVALLLVELLNQTNMPREALEVLTSLPRPEQKHLAYPFYKQQGRAYMALSDWAQAERAYLEATKHSELSTPWTAVGRARAMQKKWAESEAAFQEAIKRNSYDLMAWINRGRLALETGQVGEAIESFQEALTIAPDDQTALYALTSAYLRQGNVKQATSTFQVLMSKYPGEPATVELWNELRKRQR